MLCFSGPCLIFSSPSANDRVATNREVTSIQTFSQYQKQ